MGLLQNGGLSFDDKWGKFWTIALLPLLAFLYPAQGYACLILYKLGKRCQVVDGFENIQKSVAPIDTEEGASQLSKALFHEESVNLLTEYETSQHTFRRSFRQLCHPASGLLLEQPPGARSRMFSFKRVGMESQAVDSIDPTPFGSARSIGRTERTQVPCSIPEVAESNTEHDQTISSMRSMAGNIFEV